MLGTLKTLHRICCLEGKSAWMIFVASVHLKQKTLNISCSDTPSLRIYGHSLISIITTPKTIFITMTCITGYKIRLNKKKAYNSYLNLSNIFSFLFIYLLWYIWTLEIGRYSEVIRHPQISLPINKAWNISLWKTIALRAQ